MKELIKKYGYYNFDKGNFYVEVSDKELVRLTLKDIVISFSNDIIILTATKHFYYYSSFEDFGLIGRISWEKGDENYYDLEGKSIDDVTRKSWFLRKRYLKSSICLKLKKTEEFHIESSNWTLKILDDAE